MHRKTVLLLFVWVFLWAASDAASQTAQVGANAAAATVEKLRLDHLLYRPARWDTEHVTEFEAEHPNLGGFLCFYVTNTGDKPVDLRYWRFNNRDESYWVLNYFVAWHRTYHRRIEPGQTTVIELNATARDFGPNAPFVFSLVDDTWEPCMTYQGTLLEDPTAVSFIRVLPGLRDLEVHFRHTGDSPATFTDLEILGHPVEKVEWRGRELTGPGRAIARVTLAKPLPSSSLIIAKASLQSKGVDRRVYAHRRAFADFFPIGTWGIEPNVREALRADGVDTGVNGGRRNDEFFGDAAGRLGLRAMVHTGEPVNVEMIKNLSGHPAVACWMLRDEPDWSVPPQVMLFCDETVRSTDSTIPTFLNLCRNAKFFEYAPIADIPGHDHYSVSAPSSSKWPQPYGTRLEETAYYTADLKYASEPKPIWVWSQGNHDGWEERPLRPLPTPEELSAQLVLNIGRGAKGLLWFTYNPEMAKRYPETRTSMRGWNRAMAVLREDFLASEPALLTTEAPDKVDVAPLLSWDKLILCVTNLDYQIDPRAYPFQPKRKASVSVALPDWIRPAAAIRIGADGVSDVPLRVEKERATIVLDRLVDAAVVVLTNEATSANEFRSDYERLK